MNNMQTLNQFPSIYKEDPMQISHLLKDIYYGMMQFMVLQVIGLILIIIFPKIALWLPTLLYGQ